MNHVELSVCGIFLNLSYLKAYVFYDIANGDEIPTDITKYSHKSPELDIFRIFRIDSSSVT